MRRFIRLLLEHYGFVQPAPAGDYQPIPEITLIAYDYQTRYTGITRVWAPGSASMCRLCPRTPIDRCGAVEADGCDVCLILFPRVIPTPDCDLARLTEADFPKS